MRRRSIAIARPAQAVGAALLSGSAAVWLAAMGPRAWAEAMYGPICQGHAALSAHCPPCHVAAGLAAAGLAAIASTLGASR